MNGYPLGSQIGYPRVRTNHLSSLIVHRELPEQAELTVSGSPTKFPYPYRLPLLFLA